MEPSFSSRFAAELISFAAERGADAASLVTLSDLPRSALGRSDVRIPATTMARVWSAAIEQTGDPNLALHLGSSRSFGANRTPSLIMESSATVLEAFRAAARYSVLIADVMSVELGDAGDDLFVEFTAAPVWAMQSQAVQLDCLAITYVAATTSLKRMIGTSKPPSVLSLTFAAPDDTSVWERTFGRPVDFGADANRIGFPAAVKSHPVLTRDPGLKAAISEYADELTESFAGDPPTTRAVMSSLVAATPMRPPTVDGMARDLGLGPRGLQRSLRSEGTSYRELVERARMEVSERYLAEGEQSLDEIAWLTGYADTSSFVRAFKRHHGEPPRRSRQTLEG